jgi:hypothetical protein
MRYIVTPFEDIDEAEAVDRNCRTCRENRPSQPAESLRPTVLQDRPWERLGADLCTFENRSYLVLSDYFSRWIEVTYLSTTTASSVINKMKQVFVTHGFHDVIATDNGHQFAYKCLLNNIVSIILPAVHISHKATGLQRVQ